jgi:hypothetical protein
MYLNKLKNIKGTTVVHKFMIDVHIAGAVAISSSE